MARVLGLSFFYHDSASAIVEDGRIIAAAAEERFSRAKHSNAFPKLAIEYCLEAAGLRSINELDAIVFYEKPVVKLQRVVESLVEVWPRGLRSFTHQFPEYLSNKFNVYRVIEKSLPGYNGPILFTQHHRSHAASAFFCSPYREAAILTMDGVGEWETTTIGAGRDRIIELQRAIHFPHSIGLLYSALTGYLGFHVNDGEWKVMGLAPYGAPRYVDAFRKLIDMKADGSFQLDMDYFIYQYYGDRMAREEKWRELFGIAPREPGHELSQEYRDLARSGQAVVEEIVLNLAREAKRISGSDNLVLAGGVALNSVANWRIEAEGVFRNVWIPPAPGDDGGALGAALAVSQELFNDTAAGELTTAFLGPEYSQEEIRDFLQANEISYVELNDDDLVEDVASRIAAGEVVGWFQGRMEFGPRALGSRSILADATNPEMKAIVNQKVKYREHFRPFAPSVLAERVHEYFDVEPGADLPFMLKVPQVRAEARAIIPAVTHEDGSARVQTVKRDDAPLYYALIEAVGRRTGIAVVLNTSFNVRGEPIVCTPKDAVNCFFDSGLDALALGNCLITEKPSDPLRERRGYEMSDRFESQINANVSERVPAPLIGRRFTMQATSRVVPIAHATPEAASPIHDHLSTTRNVLKFYKELPFNYYSNSVDTAVQLLRANRVKEYTVVHRHLKSLRDGTVIDVGCGAGWFINSCAHYYDVQATGLDLNPLVLKQARAVARLMPGGERATFDQGSVFEYEPRSEFDVVNSLGVLHSTPDCHGAIRRVLNWVAPNGRFHLGLYHLYGRRPFLAHFAKMQADGASDEALFAEYMRLNPTTTDETHLLSWFRDQVLHPHETQHTYEEIDDLLRSEGFAIEATSINGFKKMPSRDTLIQMEKECERISERALKAGRYYPGFFSVWAKRAG